MLVTGSRDWPEPRIIVRDLEAVLLLFGPFTLAHGDCPKGADHFADQWAKLMGSPAVTREPHPADWARFQKRAGFVRNAEMVQLGANLVLAYIKAESPGATMCAELAEKASLRVTYRREP